MPQHDGVVAKKTAEPKAAAPASLKSDLGPPPLEDSLALNRWMILSLGVMAGQVLDDGRLSQADKRAEMLKIADRMAKLRDTDRIYDAELAARSDQAAMNERTRGPQLQDAPKLPPEVTPRRGRPPRSSLR